MSKPTSLQLWFLTTFVCLATLASGPIVYLSYHLATSRWPFLKLALYEKSDVISEIVITSSITLIGFLATIITILFSISSSKAFSRYKKMNYHRVFFSLYYFSLVCLSATAVLAVTAFSRAHSQGLFPWMIMLSISSCIQVVCVTWIIIANVQKSFCAEA
jgi:hypothetical protein